MTWFTRLLVYLLSRRPDVNVAVNYIADDTDYEETVDYLEWCYDLDPAFHHHRSFYGEDPA